MGGSAGRGDPDCAAAGDTGTSEGVARAGRAFGLAGTFFFALQAAFLRQSANTGRPESGMPSPRRAWSKSRANVESTTAAQMTMNTSAVAGGPGIEAGA